MQETSSNIAPDVTGARRDMPVVWAALPVLLMLVALADVLVWQAQAPQLSLVVMVLTLATIAQICLGRPGSWQSMAIGWGGLVFCLLPLVEEVQALSLLFAALGLLHALGWMVAGRARASALWAAVRLVWLAPLQVIKDARHAGQIAQRGGLQATGLRSWLLVLLRDWAVPLGLGLVFLFLILVANPLVESWAIALARWSPPLAVAEERLAFWLLAVILFWPLLRLTAMRTRLLREPVAHWPLMSVAAFSPGLLNVRSVMRAIVLFNLIFAVQSATDLTYLWGGVRLPQGVNYAAYAHRGAYPLLLTAVLAGGFALLAQPFLDGRPGLRALLYVWIAQTVLLVVSSILRLDLYIGAYGLTRLRFAAMIWMGLVAAGLALMLFQMATRRSAAWLFGASAMLGLLVLYVICFVNVAGLVAAHNLNRAELAFDQYYICDLGEGAVPAIRVWELHNNDLLCGRWQMLDHPADWRDWGFRNQRLRHSLTAIHAEAGKIWLPRS